MDSSKLQHTGRTRADGAGKKAGGRRGYFDYNLLTVVILLTCFGLVMLYSSSAYMSEIEYGDDMHFFGKQLLICVAGFGLMLIVSRFDYHFWMKLSPLAYLASIGCVLLILTPLGITRNNARRWIGYGGIQLQPAEVVKVGVILFIPYLICKMGKKFRTLKGVVIVIAAGAIVSGMVYLLSDNLSSALIIMGIICVLVFVAHPKTAPFLVLLVIGAALAVLGVSIIVANFDKLDGFRFSRIFVWLEPEKHTDSGGFQVLQGLYAIGSGGLFGKGLGNSVQKMGAVPEAENDMIFSIICEELGLFGAIIVTLLFVMLLYRLLFVARNAPDLYGSLVVTGVFVHIALQVVLNIAVVINLIPTTGITLPFISYGGTSIVFLMIEMGLALGVSRRITFE